MAKPIPLLKENDLEIRRDGAYITIIYTRSPAWSSTSLDPITIHLTVEQFEKAYAKYKELSNGH